MSPRAYATGWLLILALPAFGWYLSTVGPLKGFAFHLVTPESVYLANLRESKLACGTLSLRNPKVLVLGDSHSYAAWDFAALERRLGMKVGACALGGLYAESVPALVATAARASPRSKLVILGFSPRMFWESATKQEQLAYHQRTIPAMTQDAAPFIRRAFLLEPLPFDREANSVEQHRARVEALDEASILTRLELSRESIRSLREWNQRLRKIQFTPTLDRIAADICASIRAAGLRLWVLHIPESPYLESQYPKSVWEEYGRAIKVFGSCAEKTVVNKAADYRLGNRHYVNRQLKDDHDYLGWSSATPLTDDFAFDADHLNPVGARFFTRRALDHLKEGKP